MITRGSYVHKPMAKFSGASQKCLFFAYFSKYGRFQTKHLTRLFEFMKLYNQNPLENFFIFYYLLKLYFRFKTTESTTVALNTHWFLHVNNPCQKRFLSAILRDRWLEPADIYLSPKIVSLVISQHASVRGQYLFRRPTISPLVGNR